MKKTDIWQSFENYSALLPILTPLSSAYCSSTTCDIALMMWNIIILSIAFIPLSLWPPNNLDVKLWIHTTTMC